MPRNVRNFWLDAHINGRATDLEGGPASRDGGFDQVIYMRSEGAVVAALRIRGQHSGGRLVLEVESGEGLDATPTTTEDGRPALMIRTER